MRNVKQAEEAANAVLCLVNNFGFDVDTFARTIARGHKTLQQSVMRLFMVTIREMSKVQPDERNEATVVLAKKIMEVAEGVQLPLI